MARYHIIRAQGFSQRCWLCRQNTTWPLRVCSYCNNALPWNLLSCDTCAHPLIDNWLECSHCQPVPHTEAVFAATRYEYPIVQLIEQLKVQLKPEAAYVLADLLRQYLSVVRLRRYPDALTYVPSSQIALSKRGFNPAELIAQALGESLQIPVMDCFRTERGSAPQKHKSRHERVSTESPFKIYRRPPRHCAIVDDVITTGTTARQLACLIKQHGGEHIEMWAIAKTPNKTWYRAPVSS